MKVKLKEFLSQSTEGKFVEYPEKEKYITVLLYGRGIHERKISEGKTPVQFNAWIARSGQLIYSRINAEHGAYAIIPAELDGAVVSKDFPLYNIDNNQIDSNYLFYALSSDGFVNSAKKNSFGATMRRLKEAVFESMEIELPNIQQQAKIVETLNQARLLIELRQQELEKLDDLIKARFVEMFGSINDHINITEIAHTYIGLVTTMTKHYCDDGTPLLFNSSIREDRIIWDGTCLDAEFAEANKSRMHKTNDIITVHTGAIGTSAVVGEELNNSLGFATIVTRIHDTSKYYPRFITSFLNYGSGKEQLLKYSRDVRNNLNLKDYNRLMVPKADSSAQKRYVEFLEQVDKAKFAAQKALDEAQLLFDSLMQKYFG